MLFGVANAGTRAQAVRRLSAWLNCDDLILFLTDPDLKIPLPATGFRQTLPNGRAWRAFLETCRRDGHCESRLSYPNPESICPVLGFASSDGSILALIGGDPNRERYDYLAPWIPILTVALKAERSAFLATQRGIVDRQFSAQSKSLAERLDSIARENSRLYYEAEKNIVDRERVEEEQRRFVALVENSSDFIGLFSASGEMLFVNGSGLAMIGLHDPVQLSTRTFDQFFSPGQRVFSREQILPQALRAGRWTGETQFANFVSGALIDVHQTTFLITQASDKEPILATISRDVTESKRAQERLRHTAKMESLGLMAGGIAHDFNNLLTAILGNASLLVSTLDPPETALAEEIVSASERAAHLTHQLLAYSGKGQLQLKRLDLSAEVREILDLLKLPKGSNVTLLLDLQEKLPLIEADPRQIQQLILNVVMNASEAIEGRPGTVTLVTKLEYFDSKYTAGQFAVGRIDPGYFVTLEVHDTGSGMSEETRAKIFDPFFTTKFTGRGLGLAAVSGIVRGHKGALQVSSEPGNGTVFKISFPATGTIAVQQPAFVNDAQAKGTILVIDDELLVRNVAKVALERSGFKVILADDGDTGAKIFEKVSDQITLVILDLTMPRMDGEETLARLRGIRPDVPVIISSGYSEVEIRRRFASKRIDGVLQKPYGVGQIYATVQAVAGKAAAQTSNG